MVLKRLKWLKKVPVPLCLGFARFIILVVERHSDSACVPTSDIWQSLHSLYKKFGMKPIKVPLYELVEHAFTIQGRLSDVWT